MKIPHINLVLLKGLIPTEPGVFDDTVYSVEYFLKLAGFETYFSCNAIDLGALNIISGVGAHFSPSLDQIREIAKPEFSVISTWNKLAAAVLW